MPDCNTLPSGNDHSAQSKMSEKLGVGLKLGLFVAHRIGKIL